MTESLSANQLLALFEHCPFPLLIRDQHGQVVSCNGTFEKLLGIDVANELKQLDASETNDHPALVFLGHDALITWTGAGSAPCHFEPHDILLTENGDLQARFLVDVTQKVLLEQSNTALNHELRQHILTDSLTGLLNRRGVLLALEPQVARSRRYNSPISVALLQINNEENRNVLLAEIARLLKDQMRWADLVGCTEQYEFILVLPETTAEAALRLVDKLKIKLDQLSERVTDNIPIASCFGVTDWRKNDNAITLLQRAEIALNEASQKHSCDSVSL